MKAFRVSINGKKLCVAGIGDEGVLTTHVDWVAGVRGMKKGEGDLHLRIGGLISSTDTHVSWGVHHLQVGDEIRIKIVEKPAVDEPTHKSERLNPATQLRAKKRHVRMVAKELGWKIVTPQKN